MVNWCSRCGGFGRGTVPDPRREWWQFWRRVVCRGCGGDGVSKPPGWPDPGLMRELRPPPPPAPPSRK